MKRMPWTNFTPAALAAFALVFSVPVFAGSIGVPSAALALVPVPGTAAKIKKRGVRRVRITKRVGAPKIKVEQKAAVFNARSDRQVLDYATKKKTALKAKDTSFRSYLTGTTTLEKTIRQQLAFQAAARDEVQTLPRKSNRGLSSYVLVKPRPETNPRAGGLRPSPHEKYRARGDRRTRKRTSGLAYRSSTMKTLLQDPVGALQGVSGILARGEALPPEMRREAIRLAYRIGIRGSNAQAASAAKQILRDEMARPFGNDYSPQLTAKKLFFNVETDKASRVQEIVRMENANLGNERFREYLLTKRQHAVRKQYLSEFRTRHRPAFGRALFRR